MQSNATSTTLGYLSGPVDARKIFDVFQGTAPSSLFGTSYMAHLMSVCEEQDRGAVIVTTHGTEAYEARRGRFTILNRPQPGGLGLRYHLNQISWTRDVLKELEQMGVGTIVLTAAQHYWFLTEPMRRRGMRFINAYHNALRSNAHTRLGIHEAFIRLTSYRHLSHGDPTLVASPLIERQLNAENRRKTGEIRYFVPDYDRTAFSAIEPNPPGNGSVEVMFAGRVEANKGVFDFLTACEEINARGDRPFRFHVHGEGAALEELKAKAAKSPVSDLFRIYGFTEGKDLIAHYAASHIVVVPTRSEFEEGFAMSVLEGVLALKPVVTSRACPALEVVAAACEEARTDDVASYVDAIERLATDPALYAAKVEAARVLRESYFDPPNGYRPMLVAALEESERMASMGSRA